VCRVYATSVLNYYVVLWRITCYRSWDTNIMLRVSLFSNYLEHYVYKQQQKYHLFGSKPLCANILILMSGLASFDRISDTFASRKFIIYYYRCLHKSCDMCVLYNNIIFTASILRNRLFGFFFLFLKIKTGNTSKVCLHIFCRL